MGDFVVDIEWEDRDLTVYVNGQEVGYATYDLHGSAGVEVVADMARSVAEAMGAEVVEAEV